MSRLCRLKTASHGDDGKWAHKEIVKLRAELENLKAENDILSAQLEHANNGIAEWRNEALAAQAIAKEARDNDRTTFYYLSAIREAAGHDGDFPSLIEAVRKLAGRDITGSIQCATGCGSSVPVMARDEGEDHICNQCDQKATA